MKIVQVLTRGDVLGGAQSHVLELSLALSSFGHEVIVITGAPGVFTCQLQKAGIRWIPVPSLVRPLRPHRDLAALIELWFVLGRLKPDLVCAHTAKAGVLARAAARLRRIPSVFTPHGWSIFHRGSLQPVAFYCFAERLAGRLGTRVISVCEYERGLAERFAVCPAGALDVVPNGVAELFRARARPVEAQPPVMVMVARFAAQKDHSTLLRALAGLLHREWRLQLVGDGESKAMVAAQVAGLGLSGRVSLLPPETDVDRLLMEAQIFVLSTHFEAFPISILEAMRAGLPVVATDVGGVRESVSHEETGLLVGHRNEQDLRTALERMITQPVWRASLGDAGQRLWARQFTAKAMATRTVEVYQRALEGFWKEPQAPEFRRKPTMAAGQTHSSQQKA